MYAELKLGDWIFDGLEIASTETLCRIFLVWKNGISDNVDMVHYSTVDTW